MPEGTENSEINEDVKADIQEYERQIESAGDVEEVLSNDRQKKTEVNKQFLDSLKNFRLTPARYEAFGYLVMAMATSRHDIQKLLDSDFLQIEKKIKNANVWSKEYELAQVFPQLMSNRMNTALNDSMIVDIYSFAFDQLLKIIMHISDTLENEHPEVFENLFSRDARLEAPLMTSSTGENGYNGGRDVVRPGGIEVIEAANGHTNGTNGVAAKGQQRPLYMTIADLYKRGYKPAAISDMLKEKGINTNANNVTSHIAYARQVGVIG